MSPPKSQKTTKKTSAKTQPSKAKSSKTKSSNTKSNTESHTKSQSESEINLRDIWLAFALLSRLPVFKFIATQKSKNPADSVWAWPVVGGCLGALAGSVGLVCIGLGLDGALAAAVAIGTLILLSGALHEDGLADCADGFWGAGNNDKKKILAIMKDSHLGSYGVMALILFILMRVLALGDITAIHFLPAMIVVGALSRLPMAWAMLVMPPARKNGLSVATGQPHIFTLAVATSIGLFIALIFFGITGLAIFILTALGSLPVFILAQRKIGGQTGDVLGASQQCAELAGLIALALFI